MIEFKVPNILILCVFLLIVYKVLFSPFIKWFIITRKYQKVEAICVSVNQSIRRSSDGDGGTSTSTVYQPVWEYYYESQKYTSSMDASTSLMNTKVGKEKTIYVNPEYPSEIFVPFVLDIVIVPILGLFVFGVAFLMYRMINSIN